MYRSVSSGERSRLIAIVSHTRCVRSDMERGIREIESLERDGEEEEEEGR